MNAIKQRKGFECRAFTLEPGSDFIDVEYKTLRKKSRFKIHLSEVGNEIQYHSKNEIVEKVFYGISALIALFCIWNYFLGDPGDRGAYLFNSVAWGALSLCGIFVSSKDDLLITKGNRPLIFFRNKPNEKQVLEFANFLIKKANDNKKDTLINFELDQDQFLANVHWLHMMRIIDKTEVEKLQREYSLKKLL